MVRGAQKQMIVVKTQDSAVFEEAYFGVRANARGERLDMLSEANRIVESCGVGKRGAKREEIRLWLYSLGSFAAGGTLGAVIAAVLCFMR